MENSAQQKLLTQSQRILIAIVAILLATLLLVFRTGLSESKSLDQLARKSLPPEVALANNKPTIFEFYADWCEVCQKMAPSMISLEKLNRDKLDIVFLNVDNQKWQDLTSMYEVNGIPQMNFFDQSGNLKGKSVGFRSFDEIQEISNALIEKKDLPLFKGVQNSTIRESKIYYGLDKTNSKIINPRSHG